jgi:hypothetical protein
MTAGTILARADLAVLSRRTTSPWSRGTLRACGPRAGAWRATVPATPFDDSDR